MGDQDWSGLGGVQRLGSDCGGFGGRGNDMPLLETAPVARDGSAGIRADAPYTMTIQSARQKLYLCFVM